MTETYLKDVPPSKWKRFLCRVLGHRVFGYPDRPYEYCGRCGRYWKQGQ